MATLATFDDVRDLYSAEIRQHGRSPAHARRPDGFDAQARGDNPMCGDRVTVFARCAGAVVEQAGFEARGCEITVASADLMCEAVAGRSRADIARMASEVEAMARTGLCDACDPALQALKPLSAVHEYPSRVRCVTLPWAALVAALDGAQEATSE
jgi:nitrogen fixation NifU-like protein